MRTKVKNLHAFIRSLSAFYYLCTIVAYAYCNNTLIQRYK
ncbi:hypothetical protein HMPREF0645_0056 [Hallella bergensis DSM 17361]|uniref:Uncharacterized protein n=1 Tax=Hallella bergensis DSM 17361 TaxID=585502 RepID=D1PSU7_9BACT|nr:hypothetical protein HMPREF0645_0056 [Hallella bergensis DSM 17361]